MKKLKLLLATVAILMPWHDALAQVDRNRTFYHRNDGGVTVVDPDKNFFGESEIHVRRYGNAGEAYQSEYAVELALVQLGFQLLVEGGNAISDWWTERQARVQNENSSQVESLRREEEERVDQHLRSLFVNKEFYEKLVGVELYRGMLEGRLIEPLNQVKLKQIGFQYITVFDKDDSGTVYTLANITKSNNPAFQAGDVVIACDSHLFYPGFEIGAVMNIRNPHSATHTLTVIRSGELFDITVSPRAHEESGAGIAQLNVRLAAEAVYQRAVISELGIRQVAWRQQEERDLLSGLGITEQINNARIVGTWRQDAYSGEGWSPLGNFLVSDDLDRLSMKIVSKVEDAISPIELRDVTVSDGVWTFRSHWPDYGWADFRLMASTDAEFVGWSFYKGNAVDLNRWELIR